MSAASRQPAEDDRLAPDLVRQPAEEDEAAVPSISDHGDQHVGRERVDLQDVLQEEQRVELAGVPDHRLAGDEAEQGEQRDLERSPTGRKPRVSGAFELLPSSFIFWKAGRSRRSCSRIQIEMPSRKIETRNGMRQPQAAKAVLARRRKPAAISRSRIRRQEQAEGRGGLDPAGVRNRVCRAGACSAT